MKVAIRIQTFVDKKDALHQALYLLTEPIDGYDEVVVSAVKRKRFGLHETMIFPFIEGEQVFTPLSGSIEGEYDHHKVLGSLGYEIIDYKEVH